MAQVLSTKFYKFNNQYVVVEIEIDEAPELIVMSDFVIRTNNDKYDNKYGYIEDMHFLSKDGVRVIDSEIEGVNENYSRVVAIFYIDSEKFKNEQYYLSTLYGYIKVGEIEEYPDRLNKIVTFIHSGIVVKRGNEEDNALSFEEVLKKANDGDTDAMRAVVTRYLIKKDYNESIKWNLKLLSIAPEKVKYKSLYMAYSYLGDKTNADKYLSLGVERKDRNCLAMVCDNDFNEGKYDTALVGCAEILEDIVKYLKNTGKQSPFLACQIISNLVNMYMIDFCNFKNCPSSLEDSLDCFANEGLVKAQYLLGMMIARGHFGQGKEARAIELLLQCLEYKAEYDYKSRFSLILRKRAIQELLRIADPNDSRIVPYKSEIIFLFDYKNEHLYFKDDSNGYDIEHGYNCYMKANDPKLLKNPLRKKKVYKNQTASLCYASTGKKTIVNGINYYIYWRLRSSVAGNEECIYPFEIESEDFDKYTHIKIINEIMRLAANNDECKRIIEICQDEYPFLLPNNQDIKKEKKIVKEKDNSRIIELTNNLKADNLFQAQKLFKLKQYEAALKLFTQVTEEETNTKRLKTAYKYLIKMHNKGLGVKKNKYYAVSLKNKMKML